MHQPLQRILLGLFLFAFSFVMRTPSARAEGVPVHVAEPSGIARTNWPVTTGIPFPKGMLTTPSAVRLLDAEGQEMPLQTRAMETWLDGSVRWLLLDFQVSLAANATFEGSLELAPAAPIANPIEIAEGEGGGVVVNTGTIATTFAADGGVSIMRDGKPAFESFCDSRIELLEFSTFEMAYGPSRGEFRFKADEGGVAVEEAGPMRTVVRLKGWHYTSAGAKFSPSTIRYEFYRGQSVVRVMHTFVMSENPNEVMIKRIELHSKLADTTVTKVTLGGEKVVDLELNPGDAAYVIQKDVGELHYPHMNEREPQCQVVRDLGWPEVIAEGREAQGFVRISGAHAAATIALPLMREEWPKSIRAEGGGEVVIGLWPREYEPWDLRRVELQHPIPTYFKEYIADMAEARHWRGYMAGASMMKVSAMGMARTHDVFCDVGGALPGAELAEMAEKPLYAYVNSQWYCDSLALGHIWPYDIEHFSKFETYLDNWIAWLYEQQAKWKWYGILDYGDVQYVVRSPSYSTYPKDDRWWRNSGKYGWFNSGHTQDGGTLLEGLFTQWARTGDRRYMDFAVHRARHKMDVDTVHYYPDPDAHIVGGMRRHGGFDHFTGDASPSGAHTISNGLFEMYYMTGYHRAMDIAQLISDAKAAEPLELSETRSGITDMNSFMYSYNLTHDAKYLERVKGYLSNHAERQKTPNWPTMWLSYFTTAGREAMTSGEEEVMELTRQVYLQDYAALGGTGGPSDVAFAYELDPSEYNHWLVTRMDKSSALTNYWPPTIMNLAGNIKALPHLMWAVMDGRKRFADDKDEETQYTQASGTGSVPVDLTSVVNANPWAVDVFDLSSRDTTNVSLEHVKQGVYRFDFGPLDSWDPDCIPVSSSTPYPTRDDAPKEDRSNLAGLAFGTIVAPEGVPFKLIDPRANGGKAVLVLTDHEEHEIALPEGTQGVHILGHISGKAVPRQVVGAAYVFTLADGTVVEQPLTYMLDYEAQRSGRGVPHAKQSIARLKHYVYRSPSAAIVSMRIKDLGEEHRLMIAAITAEVKGAAPAVVATKPLEVGPATLTYGMQGGVSENSNVGLDAHEQAQAGATLPAWQTNRLLGDCVSILEVLEPRHFIADVPSGAYELTVWFAQPYDGCKNIFYAKAQGETLLARAVSSFSVERGRMFKIQIKDGKFDLEIGIPEDDFEKNAHWGIRALELRRVAE